MTLNSLNNEFKNLILNIIYSSNNYHFFSCNFKISILNFHEKYVKNHYSLDSLVCASNNYHFFS